MTYSQVLAFVFESGRITSGLTEEDRIAEVEAEVHFEASERAQAGELEGDVEGCVQYALEHVG